MNSQKVQLIDYKEIRNKMQPGDVIAFAGRTFVSKLIQWTTKSKITHVGVILQSKLLIDDQPQSGYFNQVVESAEIDGFAGVSTNRLSKRIEYFNGEIWWLRLKDELRQNLDFKKYYDFLLHQEGKEYDKPQAISSAFDRTDNLNLMGDITFNKEDFSKFFCSELVAAALEAGGIIKNINASEVTPADLVRFNLYESEYYQLKGDVATIGGFNTLSPEKWGM